MIVERLVFHAKFGQGDDVAKAFAEWRDVHGPRFGLSARVMIDVTGPMFTVVLETDYRDLSHVAQVQADLEKEFARPEFGAWFQKWSSLTESGTRELYRVVD
jgi:hypothetical protein